MASQVNSQYAYINLINGETVWERLRIVRNFVEDRKIAKKLQTTQEKKRKSLEAKLEEAVLAGLRSAILSAEVELEEFDAHKEQQEDGYRKLDAELEFLLFYEAELAAAAEKTRVVGKTDDEMYQINMESEVYLRNMRKIEMERTANTLGISHATAEEAMRVPKLRKQLLSTATAMSIPYNDDNKDIINNLISSGINLDTMPLSVQEELGFNSKLLNNGVQK